MIVGEHNRSCHLAAGVLAAWGVAHLVPTRNVVAGVALTHENSALARTILWMTVSRGSPVDGDVRACTGDLVQARLDDGRTS